MRLVILSLLLLPGAAFADPVTITTIALHTGYHYAVVVATLWKVGFVLAASVYGSAQKRKAERKARDAYNAGLQDRMITRVSTEAPHTFGAVVEPPRRPEPQRGVDASQGCQFAGIGCLVQCEENHCQVPLQSDGIQQGLDRADIVGAGGDVEAHIAPVPLEHRRRVVARRSWMDLQNEPVIQAHLRHLG